MDSVSPRLTDLAHGGGCGCKLAPAVLQSLLARQPAAQPFSQLLVGNEMADDAAVWQIDDNTCIIATTDFFMPMVDDPFDFGRIAATNAISDIYAMGGKPILALAILGMPISKLEPEKIGKILEGGAAICAQAGIPVAGGHSIDSVEPIYGLAVIGICHPSQLKRNGGAKSGDALILTKGIGIGIYSSAIKKSALPEGCYEEMIASTTLLNRIGTELASSDDIHALTDVTGFGILGHGLEMARASNLSLHLSLSRIPFLQQAEVLAQKGFITGASNRNWASYGQDVQLPDGMPEWQRLLLADPQTSGGLLLACEPSKADAIVDRIRAAGYPRTALIGHAAIGEPKVSGYENPYSLPRSWRTFDITTKVDLKRAEGPAQLWLPVAQSAGDYQKAQNLTWIATGADVRMTQDPASKAQILFVSWKNDSERSIELTQRVSTRNRTADDTVAAHEDELSHELRGTKSMPTDGIVKDTAMRIIGNRTHPEEKARAIYDWVIDNTFRDAKIAGCGVGNVKDMLESGYFGGKCADISSLFVALARAAGLPARDVFGIRVADSGDFKSLGRAGDITKAQHCRAEVYVGGRGWIAVDPADVRKVVLEENLPLDNPAVQAFREKAFGNWEMNWIGYNSARDLTLPGGDLSQGFLMYPAAVTSRGELDCLSPQTFAYAITSREVTA
eukprot:g3910.t1